MKKMCALVLVLMLVLLVGCVTVPALGFVDTTGFGEATQPYVDAWGPPDVINTHICSSCEGVVFLGWVDVQDQMIHYAVFERIGGEWVITGASEALPEEAEQPAPIMGGV